jgi:NAD-dependent dihydropyrimidine dehydrogenase PreA subunit
MIEFLFEEHCTGCNDCVQKCPANVFSLVAGGKPVIARQSDCQTCYMCELYCPEDALFVGSDCERAGTVSRQQVLAAGWLGQIRRDSGWGEWASDPKYRNQMWYMAEVFKRGAEDSKGEMK